MALLPMLLAITLSVHLFLHQAQSSRKAILASQTHASIPINHQMPAEALPDDAFQSLTATTPPTWWQLVSNLMRFDYGNSTTEPRSAWSVVASKAPI